MLVGACLGFLPHNFYPARIFMGDSGSMLIGLLLATSTVGDQPQVDPAVVELAQIVPAFLPIVLPLAVFALPLIDLALAVVRRTRAGKMFWAPTRCTCTTGCWQIGHSHARAVLILYVWTATLAFGVASVAFIPPLTALAAGFVAVLLALALTLGPLRGRARPTAPRRVAGPKPPTRAGARRLSGPAAQERRAVGRCRGERSARDPPPGPEPPGGRRHCGGRPLWRPRRRYRQ